MKIESSQVNPRELLRAIASMPNLDLYSIQIVSDSNVPDECDIVMVEIDDADVGASHYWGGSRWHLIEDKA